MGKVRYRVLFAALLAAILLFPAFGADASPPPLAVTPDPIVVHIGTAQRVPFGTTVPITVTIPQATVNGNILSGLTPMPFPSHPCRATSPVVTCTATIPALGPGTYTLFVRFIPLYANSGPAYSGSVTLQIVP